MKFLVDAQIPRRLALWLRGEGHDAMHTLDLPDGNRTSDAEIARRADAEGRVVVTKDADFARSFRLSGTPARLLVISAGNVGNTELLSLWRANMPALLAALERHRFIELGQSSLVVHE